MLRRRSPGWVRALDDRAIHGIALRLRQQEWDGHPLSSQQEWLWRALVSELEYRSRTTKPAWLRCACELCVPPFPDHELTYGDPT